MEKKERQVEKILTWQLNEDGKRIFEIQWRNSWEDEETIMMIEPKMLDVFLANNPSVSQTSDESPVKSAEVKKGKRTGGILAVISRLQKTQEEELSKNASFDEDMSAEATQPPTRRKKLHTEEYHAQMPLSPPRAVEATGGNLPVLPNTLAPTMNSKSQTLADTPMPPLHYNYVTAPKLVLKCSICLEAFYEETKFRQHMFMHDQVSLLNQDPPQLLKPGTFECKFCFILFSDKEKIKEHYSEEHEEEFVHMQPNDQLYHCYLCQMTFMNKAKHADHMKTHTVEKPPVVENNDDSASATITTTQSMTTLDFRPVNEALISKSIESERMQPTATRVSSATNVAAVKMFRCNLCDEMFEKESDRAQHSLVHVDRTNSLDCHICGKQFRHRTNLTTHLIVHSGVKPHQCPVCLRRFTQKVNLQRHMHIHDGSRPYACAMCPKSFTQKSNLQRHILSHTEKTSDDVLRALHEIPNESEVNNTVVREANGDDKQDLRCEVCDKVFAQKVNLQKHMMIHTGAKPFQCYVCGKSFRQRSSLQKHYTIHTNGSNSFNCQTCHRMFGSRTNLQRHMLVHVVNQTQCYLCNQGFTTIDNLERHFSEHVEEALPISALPHKVFEHVTPGQQFRCTTCNIVFDSPIVFRQHLQCHQNNPGEESKPFANDVAGPLPCTVCGLIFMNHGTLQEHMNCHRQKESFAQAAIVTSNYVSFPQHFIPFVIEAGKEEQADEQGTSVNVHRCSVCQDLLPTKEALKEHYQSKHGNNDALFEISKSDTPLYDVGVESMTLTEDEERLVQENLDFIKDNILGGADEYLSKSRFERGTYSCKICNRTLTYKYSLEKHMLMHTSLFPFKCHLCSKRFNHKPNLDKHLIVHSGEKPHVCHLCNRAFSQKSNLQRHQLTHTQNRDFVCDVCGKRFNHMASLKTHSLIHTGAKPFSCYICSKRFNQKGNLKRHVHTHKSGKRNKLNSQRSSTEQQDDYSALEESSDATSYTNEDIIEPRENQEVKSEHYELYEEDPLPTMLPEKSLNSANEEKIETEVFAGYYGNDEEILTVVPSDELEVKKLKIKKECFHCDSCSKLFTTMSSLDAHKRSHHSLIVCDVCGKQFSQKANLLKHKLIHMNKKPFPCKVCNKAFRQKANLQRHEIIHTKERKTVNCAVCHKSFRCAWSLKQHSKSHVDTARITCAVCNEAFSSRTQLKQHFAIHDDIPVYSCIICAKKFQSKDNLLAHVTTHENVPLDIQQQIEEDQGEIVDKNDFLEDMDKQEA